ncbi:hypothetical protein SUDANB121_02945 [Nocardiopsis dassonvillei]|uniref:DUF4407 domain-containing protein n=1 Tax=Nocardiopsis dassonvillei TaxID=2014 RepID=UPI003F57740A
MTHDADTVPFAVVDDVSPPKEKTEAAPPPIPLIRPESGWAAGPSRWLRRLTGVDEDLIARIDLERPGYTLQGMVVLATALMAGISMFVALDRFTPAPLPVVAAVALFWAGVILVFDCWMLSVMHGSRGNGWGYLGRVLISVVISLVVAEPLLLTLFRPSIEHELTVTREQEQDTFRSALERCNPVSGEQSTEPDCVGEYLLSLGDDPFIAQQSELETVTGERDELRERVENLQAELDEKNKKAQEECNGTSGEGLSGIVGVGPSCTRLREEADDFARTSSLAEYQEDLREREERVVELTGEIGTSSVSFAQARAEAIDERVQARAAEAGRHGIIDEMEALGRLAADSLHVLAAVWLVRILLALVDMFPVLTKILVPRSRYDGMYAKEAAVRQTLHDMELREYLDHVRMMAARRDGERERSIRETELRDHAALMNMVDAQAARYRGEEGTDGDRDR